MPASLPSIETVVLVLGLALCAMGAALCVRVATVRFRSLPAKGSVWLVVTSISALAYYKLMAFTAMVVVPLGTATVANYHVFEGSKTVGACNRCHVMRPMVTDMHDPQSDTLAAKHYRNRWIADKQCYECHTDYGLAGSLEAKLDGYRHLTRYVTGSYEEPVEFVGQYDNGNCLDCHGPTPAYQEEISHEGSFEDLAANEGSCLDCHAEAHPSPERRTPGHPDYLELMGGER